jgi:hypothetical protein
MFQIISGTSKTVSGTQNLERNVPTTAHKNVPTNSRLLGTLFQLAFPVWSIKAIKPIERGQEVLMNYGARYQYPSHYGPALL